MEDLKSFTTTYIYPIAFIQSPHILEFSNEATKVLELKCTKICKACLSNQQSHNNSQI